MDGTMDVGSAAILGAVQGATEFLPVSSSGHIALGAMILGVSDELPLTMVVLLHFATLVATVALFRKDLGQLTGASLQGMRTPRRFAESEAGHTVLGVLLASVPTALIGVPLEKHMEDLSRDPRVLGLGLLGSAVMVLSTLRGGGQASTLSYGRMFLIGVAQGAAVLPGLSRSGTTIAVAMMLGMSGPAAFRFSFLLSLPAVAGATLLSLRHVDELTALGWAAPVGALVALSTGALALVWLRRLVQRGHFHLFALYLIPVGIGVLLYPYVR